MSARGEVQAALVEILSASERAMTVVELADQLDAAGLDRVHSEPIYRGLGALQRRGVVRRVLLPGQSRVHLAVAGSAALGLCVAADPSDFCGVEGGDRLPIAARA